MRKTVATILFAIILILIGFATFELFCGNFPAAMSTFPVIVFFYLFVVFSQKKNR